MPKKKEKKPHVFMRGSDLAWECLNCAAVYKMNMPCNVSVYVAASRAFDAVHRYCRPGDKTLGQADDR